MSTFAAPLTPESVRQLLHAFWQESLEIAKSRQGLSLALPQTYPDGWQIVVDLEDHLPAGLKLTDQGCIGEVPAPEVRVLVDGDDFPASRAKGIDSNRILHRATTE